LPKLHNGYVMLRAVVNGWHTDGLVQVHSGDALTAWVGSDVSATGLTQDRMQRNYTLPAYSRSAGNVGTCAVAQPGKSCVNWINSTAFTTPVNTGAGTGFGNIVKGSLRGPRYTNWNGSLVRTFPVYRESSLEFRMEYFDVLNHTELNNPDMKGVDTGFGAITGEAGPRIGQFALKFNF